MKAIDLMTTANHYLALENEVIETYLQRMSPELLTGMQEMVNAVPLRPHTGSSQLLLYPRSTSAHSMLNSRRGTEDSGSIACIHSIIRPSGSTMLMPYGLDRRPRINMSIKEDIAGHETDDLQAALDKLHVTSTKARADLKAELEEVHMTVQEICEAHANLKAVREAVDPITGCIPAEKFVRHVEEWLKKADSMIEKLRLRTSTLRSVFTRMNQLVEQKEVLGENLHQIDFEQLKIENSQLLETVMQKNHNLLKMKKMTGQCNLLLTNQKKKVMVQMSELSHMQEMVAAREAQVKRMENEADLTEMEVQKATQKLDSISEVTENYMAPDIMDYVKKQAELHQLKQALKVWSHRKKIQQTALISCRKLLHKLTINEVSQTH
ncbi:coiled-coil domain-containing protein 113-like isoform X2 [Cryptotermes secundus]|nr:coiled-coil domain-containing protein 113-like isoform X2 [Cryptotermes secundus]